MADPQGGSSAGGAANSGPSLFGSLRSFWSVLLAILYTRLDLATTELQEQGVRVIQLLLAGFIAVVALLTAFFLLNFWFIAAYWDDLHSRLLVIGIIFAVYALIGVIAAAIATSIVKAWPGILSQTIKELRKDVEGLQVLLAKDKEAKK